MPILDQNGAPTLVNVHQLERAIIDEQAGRSGSTRERRSDGRWYRARSFGWHGLVLRTRLRLAWRVFTGRYDALSWETPDAG
ncbi:MAG: hypothetical protein IPK85_02380 [Gemmatimonadetes bacterium]|nr:hypothetical protein [Gemmatimonadota bacterium]